MASPVFPKQVTLRNILRVLIAGFALVILLLVAAGFNGVRSVRLIQESAARLVAEQLVANGLIEEVQNEQEALSAVFHDLERDIGSVEQNRVLSRLEQADQTIQRLVAAAQDTPEAPLWSQFKRAETAFSAEARRLLARKRVSPKATRDLLKHHRAVLVVASRLIAASRQKALQAQSQLEQRCRRLVRDSVLLLGAGLLLAVVCASLTVWMTTGLFHRMAWQTGELSRVSWHMLDNQESAARRFSHELHDELGQSLTAVKANLLAMQTSGAVDEKRIGDCLQLLDEAVHNVRELSQLLRPTILDDFGLDASLRWLGERFTQRTGIAVDYQSNLTDRLADETETHLFRIAQEALTNAARHSGSSRVAVELRRDGKRVHLTIADDGRGLDDSGKAFIGGLGMTGMRARARNAGGELTVHSAPGKGVRVEAWVPALTERHETKTEDPHLVG